MTQFKSNRTKPCKECPFAKNNNLKGFKPGGADPLVYVGQSEGPFWLPCHMEKEYNGKDTDPSKVNQCAGAAIYRANVGVASKMPEKILALPEDKDNVFNTHAELYAHYTKTPLEIAEQLLTKDIVKSLMHLEMNKTVKKL